MDDLVSTQWLAERLDTSGLAIVDCSAFLPGMGRDGAQEFLQAHIPGARFLDIGEVADRSHPAPHMMTRYEVLLNASGVPCPMTSRQASPRAPTAYESWKDRY